MHEPEIVVIDYRADYEKYLRSQHWWELKRDLWRMRPRCCTVCQSKDQVDPHHLIYRTPLSDGRVTDLMPLCRRCHDIVHDFNLPSRFDPNLPASDRWRQTENFIRHRLIRMEELAERAKHQSATPYVPPAKKPRKRRWQDYAAHQQAEAAVHDLRWRCGLYKDYVPPVVKELPKIWKPPLTAKPSKIKRWFDV